MRTRFLALFLCAASAALAADPGFDRLVRSIEFHYSAKRTHIPFMGLANMVVKVAHPGGAKDFKLALFEHLDAQDDPAGVDRILRELAAKGFRPTICQQSRRSGESTLIFTGEVGKDTRMLIATFGRNEATVIQVTVDPETLMKTLEQPGMARRTFYPGNSDEQ